MPGAFAGKGSTKGLGAASGASSPGLRDRFLLLRLSRRGSRALFVAGTLSGAREATADCPREAGPAIREVAFAHRLVKPGHHGQAAAAAAHARPHAPEDVCSEGKGVSVAPAVTASRASLSLDAPGPSGTLAAGPPSPPPLSPPARLSIEYVPPTPSRHGGRREARNRSRRLGEASGASGRGRAVD